MTDQVTLACRHCVFWRAASPDDGQAPCNRYPGNVVGYPDTTLDLSRGQQGTEWKFTVVLPQKAPHEWCGEFKPRPQVVQ